MAIRTLSARPCSAISAYRSSACRISTTRNDIDALASLICACDIVVTVSNTTAHLAGALGKETYLLVPSGRGRMWCWFRDRDDSPFYPRMRLKRRQPEQPWAELAGAVAAEIGSRGRRMLAISARGHRIDLRTERKAIDQAIEAGVELHRRGLLDDAERLYAGILKLAPKHFDAMHLLGVVHQQRGDSDKALKLIGAALELNDASADAFTNHGNVLLQLRRFDEALVSIDRALALAPDHAQALINRATIRIEQRRFADALADTLQVAGERPD